MPVSPPAGVSVRAAVAADAEAFALLHLDCWDEAYAGLVPQQRLDARRADLPAAVERRRAWLRDAARTGVRVLLALAGSNLVGFVAAGRGRDDDPAVGDVEVEVQALYVRAAWWGAGIGHALLTEAVGDRDAYLWTLAANTRALGFYGRQGFAPDGATRDDPDGPLLRMVRRKART